MAIACHRLAAAAAAAAASPTANVKINRIATGDTHVAKGVDVRARHDDWLTQFLCALYSRLTRRIRIVSSKVTSHL
jgi:hypothetical protein